MRLRRVGCALSCLRSLEYRDCCGFRVVGETHASVDLVEVLKALGGGGTGHLKMLRVEHVFLSAVLVAEWWCLPAGIRLVVLGGVAGLRIG